MIRSPLLVGREINHIPTPALLLDLNALDSNLDTMARLFEGQPCALRPHMKSHKSVMIAHLQMRKGAKGITCAKLGEAETLVNGGIPDVLIANQVVGIDKIVVLAGLARYSRMSVGVDNKANCTEISQAAARIGTTVGAFVEVDVGLDRCGVKNSEDAVELARHIASLSNLEFRGILAYEGSLCGLPADEKKRKADAAMMTAMVAKEAIEKAGIPVPDVSSGGTGTWHLTGRYPGVTEIQPGSYVHMEIRYVQEGHPFLPALSVLSTVVSKSAEKLILDAGVKAITSDQGLPALFDSRDIPVRLDEEHGHVLRTPAVDYLQVGDKVRLMPSHACTTVNLYDEYVCTRNGLVEAVWEIEARGKTT